MEFLNLTLGQFLAAFSVVAAFSVALYLLDRTRKRYVVSTLRFWVTPGQPAPVSRNRRIRQPLSLLLQLIGMALLLLALAEFQFSDSIHKRRDHVLVLDTSAWMAATLPNRGDTTLMDVARADAIAWLRAVPASDRVLVIRADGLATPATAWERDHRKAARAILESQPRSTALNMSLNLEFARELQRQSGSAGEIVYAGPGRISAREAAGAAAPVAGALRVLNVDDAIENTGLRSVGARRSETDSGTWDVLVRVRNYGSRPRSATVTLNYGNAPQGAHPLDLAPGAETETLFRVHTRAAGLIEARIYPKDGFGADNYAALELPEQRALHVIVYTDQPELIRPALSSDPRVSAEFRTRAQYTPANDGLVILDRFHPDAPPQGNVLWIDPPADKPPVPIRERAEKPEGLRWLPDQPLTEGLRARNAQIESSAIFERGPGTIVVAEVGKGPVIVARASADRKSRIAVTGFNPFAGAMRYELTTPLLLANILRWMSPDVFRDVDLGTQSAGTVSSPLAASVDRKSVRVETESGTALPFNVRDRSVQFFSGDPARVRVLAANAERVYSLSLPEMWDTKWTPPANILHGIPPWSDSIRRSTVLWPWLAVLGAAVLIVEWVIYGAASSSQLRIVRRAA